MKVDDGGGSGRSAIVTAKQRLATSAATLNQRALVSVKDGQTYTWTTSWSADTGEDVIYIQNTSKDKLLFIDKVTVNAVLTALFELYVATGTAAGTALTGVNTNLTSNNVAAANAFGGAEVTGTTDGARIDLARIPALGRADMELEDILILGFNDAISLKYTGGTGIVDVIVTGYFEITADL